MDIQKGKHCADQWILARFDFSQNEFEMRLVTKSLEGPLK